jgi:hypothetical protein
VSSKIDSVSAHRDSARRLAGILLLALMSLGATRGNCPMWLDPSAEEPAGHGCCGDGIASQPPSCCDAGVRTPDATAREEARLSAPALRLSVHHPLAIQEPTEFSGAATPLGVVHGPPHSILRI